MATPKITGSASLSLKLGAFAGLFTALSASFVPVAAFTLALLAAIILAKL